MCIGERREVKGDLGCMGASGNGEGEMREREGNRESESERGGEGRGGLCGGVRVWAVVRLCKECVSVCGCVRGRERTHMRMGDFRHACKARPGRLNRHTLACQP